MIPMVRIWGYRVPLGYELDHQLLILVCAGLLLFLVVMRFGLGLKSPQ